ncbi:hypothetical protein TNCV_2254681 [Trichonephila clavipes]|nr:hypothetical protein TNCV_2254681 [Trichonephila clavipes]
MFEYPWLSGSEHMADVSWVRVLVPLKTRRENGLMHIISVGAQNPPKDGGIPECLVQTWRGNREHREEPNYKGKHGWKRNPNEIKRHKDTPQEVFEIAIIGTYAQHRSDMDWRSCSKIPGVSRFVAATMDIRTTRSLSELTGMSCTKLFMTSQRKIPEEVNQEIWVWEAKR